ncbi:MAG: VOC family protein [Saprospiraceae bacterium]|nr:VOC family protein [Saprospiraceae bacterium]
MKPAFRSLFFLVWCVFSIHVHAQSEFSQNYISIGVVVEDLETSIDFYTNMIGMTIIGGFTVDSEGSKKTGLTGGIPFDVTVLKLEDNPSATEWKLLSFDKQATHPEQKYIQDDTGMQYITIFVNDLHPFVNRLKENNIPLLGETPTQLSGGRHFVLVQDPDGVFIELIGPMK